MPHIVLNASLHLFLLPSFWKVVLEVGVFGVSAETKNQPRISALWRPLPRSFLLLLKTSSYCLYIFGFRISNLFDCLANAVTDA